MDYIGVLVFDASGKAGRRAALPRPVHLQRLQPRPWDIPLVRERYEHVMRQSGLAPNSHSGKALRTSWRRCRATSCSSPRGRAVRARDGHPRPAGALAQQAVPAPRPLRPLLLGAGYIPRDRFNTDVRLRIEALLRTRCNGERLDTNVQVGRVAAGPAAPDRAPAQRRIGRGRRGRARGRSWPRSCATGRTSCAICWSQRHGEERGLRLAQRYGKRAAGRLHRAGRPRSPPPTSSRPPRCTGRTTCACACTAAPARAANRLRFKLYRHGSPSCCRTRCR
jgi:glutamate dehydrogenase